MEGLFAKLSLHACAVAHLGSSVLLIKRCPISAITLGLNEFKPCRLQWRGNIMSSLLASVPTFPVLTLSLLAPPLGAGWIM